MAKRVFIGMLKAVIIAVSFLNIAWFLLFDYVSLKEISKSALFQEEASSKDVPISGASFVLSVPPGSMKYNGSGMFDPLKGVHVVDSSGHLAEDIGITYTVNPSPNGNMRDKTIVYEAVSPDGVLTAERSLSLGLDYLGPSVSVTGALPFCREGEISSYAKKLIDSGSVQVLDGFGGDITTELEVFLKRYDKSDESAAVTISASNVFGDMAQAVYQAPMNDTGFVLTLLNTRAVILPDSSFNVKDYVDRCFMEDEDGTAFDLTGNVRYDGSVDTHTEDSYDILVYAVSPDGLVSVKRPLEVIVAGRKGAGDESE